MEYGKDVTVHLFSIILKIISNVMRLNDKHNWKCEVELWLFADTKVCQCRTLWKNLAGIRASKRGYQVAQSKVKNKKLTHLTC